MLLESLLFYVFATLIGLSAIIILLSKNVLYSALALMLSFLGVAAIYVFAGADFIATVQIIVYAGGILVLLIFGVMFTKKSRASGVTTSNRNIMRSLFVSGGIFILLATAMAHIQIDPQFSQNGETIKLLNQSKVQAIGMGLMTDYIVPFELAAVLLLIALIGAVFISGKELKK